MLKAKIWWKILGYIKFSCTWWKFDMTDFLQFAVAININVSLASICVILYGCFDSLFLYSICRLISLHSALINAYVYEFMLLCSRVSRYLYAHGVTQDLYMYVFVCVKIFLNVNEPRVKCWTMSKLTNVRPVWRTNVSNMHAHQ